MSRARTAFAICRADEVLDGAATLDHTFLTTCQLIVPASADTAPDWIELVPAGENIEALDGRKFKNPDPSKVVERFNSHPIDLPLDWEHSTEVKAPKGDEAPAAGWIKQLEIRNGAIYARIEWTKRGSASVCSKEYRYVSPAFTYNKDREILAIASAGLTNHPALVMKALSHQETSTASAVTQPAEEITMDPEIAEALGLDKNADKKAVLCAAKALMSEHADLKKKHDKLVDQHEVMMRAKASAETEVATLRAQAVDPKTVVSKEELNLALARVATLEATVKDGTDKALATIVDTEIDAALKASKITPAQVPVCKAMCSREGGLEDFRKLVAVAVPVAPDKIAALDGAAPGVGLAVLTSADRKIMAECHLSEEEYRGGQKKVAIMRKNQGAMPDGDDED